MDGNVVFGGQNNTSKQESVAPSAATAPTSPQQVTSPVTPVQNLPPATPPPPISGGSGILGRLLKILIPLVVIALLIVAVVMFVLPMFRSGSFGTGGNVTITYWGLWESKEVMQPVIEAFEKDHPNIKVTYEQRDSKQYKETLLTRIGGGDGPDVFRFHNSWTKTMQSVLTPLPSSVITADEFKKYYPVVQSDMTINGGIYGIPLMMDTLAMFVNDSILSDYGIAPPQTWDEFLKVASAVTVPDESGQIHTYGAAIGSYDNVERAPDIISTLFAQNRIDLKQLTKADPAKYVEALRFYTNFVTGHDNFVKVWNPTGQPALEAFAGGNVAMYFGYSWDIFTIQAKSPDLKYSIHPVPYLSTPLSVASYWADGVSAKSIASF
jgi:multiple sugar transport system substrate-binding protein